MARSGVIVAFRSAQEIESMAATVRKHLGVPKGGRISMQPILEHMLDLIFEDGHFEIEEDRKMGGAEARTAQYEPKIIISQSTYDALGRGEGRARMTIAHEIGHLLMHCQRLVTLNRSPRYDQRYDPEWQADVFAAALLMPRGAFQRCKTVREAMIAFGVTWSAAVRRAQVLHVELAGMPEPKGAGMKKGR